MKRIQFCKEQISIQNIGRQKFWIGIVAGLISAVAISSAFNHFREVFRFLTTMSADLLILKDNELLFFNYFFAALSTVLGLSITIWIWMSNHAPKRRTERIYKQLSRTNALLIFWVILMLIARFGSTLPLSLFGMPGYDNQLNLQEDYWILFVLIPIVVFTQSWFSVRLVYRAGKWIFLSCLFCVLTAFTLQLTTTVNQEKLNNSYYLRFKTDYQYVDEEINNAKIKYGVEFDTKTIDILKKWHSENSIEQVMSIKSAFSSARKVPMDTIILQKILIRNFKNGSRYYQRSNSIENWPYALPKDILEQIKSYDVNSNETRELLEVLKEQIDLVNTPKINWDEYANYTETERRKSLGAKYDISKPLIGQLQGVRDSLVKDEKYSDFAKDLPKIKNERINKNAP